MNKMLRVSLLLLGLFVGILLPVQAQLDEVWTDVDLLLAAHPEIVAKTMSRLGVVPNGSGSNIFGSYITTGEDCESPFDFDLEAWSSVSHFDTLVFHYDLESPESYLFSVYGDGSNVTLIAQKDYYVDGFHVLVWKFIFDPNRINQGYAAHGFIELPNKYGYWQGFSLSETCEDTFGVHLPDIEQVLSTFLVILDEYGFTTPSALATQMAAMPSPTPYVYEALPLTPGEASESEPEGLLTDDGSLGEGLAPATIGGAALGALLGAFLMQIIPALRSPGGAPPKPVEPIYYSPATGKPAPLEQVQEEESRMKAGYIYREGEGWVAPHAEPYVSDQPGILTRLVEEERARLREEFDRYTAERRARLKQERIEEYSDMADRHIQANRESLDRVLNGVDIAEAGIDTAIDVGTSLLIRRFPVKTVGRARVILKTLGKKWLQPAVSMAYDQVRLMSKNVVKWAHGKETSVVVDELCWLLTLPSELIPAGRFANVARAFVEEVAKGTAKTAAQKTAEEPVKKVVDYVKNSSFFTGE